MITRIRELLETRQLTPTQFADLIGVGRPVISHILSERNKPSLEVVQKIIGAFPDVSLHWLLTGIGSMQASAAPLSSPIVAPVASPEPQAAPPTPIPSPQPPQAFSSIAIPAARPAQLPLPPKFRPAAKATSQPAKASPSPVSTPSIPTAPIEAPLPMTVVTPMPELAAAPTPAPVATAPTPVPTPALVPPFIATSPNHLPVADRSVSETQAPTQATAPVSTAMTEAATATPTNQAAALSFLGEPGKAIRRIVIFYRDGSFSDYVPEGF
jgi:DNA-binding XRE family transcriptional regulator